MSKTAHRKPKQTLKNTLTIRAESDLLSAVKDTASAVQLSQQDTIRQALRRGLPILKQLMTAA